MWPSGKASLVFSFFFNKGSPDSYYNMDALEDMMLGEIS